MLNPAPPEIPGLVIERFNTMTDFKYYPYRVQEKRRTPLKTGMERVVIKKTAEEK
jgi:hypothetical protein